MVPDPKSRRQRPETPSPSPTAEMRDAGATTRFSPLPVIAIVGRPNVGKSALFNRIVRRRIAIVHEESGVTRDVMTAETEWAGCHFTLVDTGGIALQPGQKSADAIADAVRRQAQRAIREAAAVVLVVDVTTGLTPLDEEVAAQLRSSGRPVFLAVNKVDNATREDGIGEFTSLGFDKVFAVSALHGRGVDELLAAVVAVIPSAAAKAAGIATAPPCETEPPLSLAVIGRPNVGKSSLVNCLLNEERVIVTEIPGTTRDAIDIPCQLRCGQRQRACVLIDTAGIRHVRKVRDSVEVFSVMRARKSIERCDIAVLVLDALDGVTSQDKRIGGMVAEANRGCVIAVNKWDLVPHNKVKPAEYAQAVRQHLFFLNYAPIVFVSAVQGTGAEKLVAEVFRVDSQMNHTVATAALNRAIVAAVDAYQPPLRKGRHLRVYYGNQVGVRPPAFLLFVNDPSLCTPHYERYLADRIRKSCGLENAPLKLTLRGR